MKQYFLLQTKRLLRYLPGAFLVVVLLLGGLAGVLGVTQSRQAQKEENNKFPIGVVGSLDDPLLQVGVETISTYDSSQFSLELQPMTQAQAKKDLATGKISAYIVVPDGFMEHAMGGRILPLKFVTGVGSSGLTTLMQKEVTDAVSLFLLDAQKGVYGMDAATYANDIYVANLTDMALRYAEFVLVRDEIYQVESLGIGDGLDLGSYLLCGFLVLFLLLCALPFGAGLIRRDYALGRMLAARGRTAFRQTVCDFLSYCLVLMGMVLAVALLALCIPSLNPFGKLLLLALPVALLAAAMSYFLYSLATDLIGGLLLQFFVSLCMCFVSGCLYPVFFFPSGIQKIAGWLPAGVARTMLAGACSQRFEGLALLVLLGYSFLFFLAGSRISCRRIQGVSR